MTRSHFLALSEAVRENRPRSFVEFTVSEDGTVTLSYRARWSYVDQCVVSEYGGAR